MHLPIDLQSVEVESLSDAAQKEAFDKSRENKGISEKRGWGMGEFFKVPGFESKI